jgi:hypothetical protein
MRLSALPQYLDLRIAEVVPTELPGHCDVRLEASLHGKGFAGASSAWVDADVFRGFSLELTELVTHFHGEAVLESISLGDLSLRLVPANGRGYVRVEVSLAEGSAGTRWGISGSFDVELAAVAALLRWAEAPRVEDA